MGVGRGGGEDEGVGFENIGVKNTFYVPYMNRNVGLRIPIIYEKLHDMHINTEYSESLKTWILHIFVIIRCC